MDLIVELLLVFHAGTRLCGVPLESVVETLRPLPVEPMAGQSAIVSGICVVRGEPAPVLNVALLIGGDADQPVTRFISMAADKSPATEGHRRPVVLAVDSVLGVREVESESVHDLPPLLSHVASNLVGGLGMVGGDSLLLLRDARLLADSLDLDLVAASGPSPS